MADEHHGPIFDSPPITKPDIEPRIEHVLDALGINHPELAEDIFARVSKGRLATAFSGACIRPARHVDASRIPNSEPIRFYEHRLLLWFQPDFGPSLRNEAKETLELELNNFAMSVTKVCLHQSVTLIGALETSISESEGGRLSFSWKQRFITTR